MTVRLEGEIDADGDRPRVLYVCSLAVARKHRCRCRKALRVVVATRAVPTSARGNDSLATSSLVQNRSWDCDLVFRGGVRVSDPGYKCLTGSRCCGGHGTRPGSWRTSVWSRGALPVAGHSRWTVMRTVAVRAASRRHVRGSWTIGVYTGRGASEGDVGRAPRTVASEPVIRRSFRGLITALITMTYVGAPWRPRGRTGRSRAPVADGAATGRHSWSSWRPTTRCAPGSSRSPTSNRRMDAPDQRVAASSSTAGSCREAGGRRTPTLAFEDLEGVGRRGPGAATEPMRARRARAHGQASAPARNIGPRCRSFLERIPSGCARARQRHRVSTAEYAGRWCASPAGPQRAAGHCADATLRRHRHRAPEVTPGRTLRAGSSSRRPRRRTSIARCGTSPTLRRCWRTGAHFQVRGRICRSTVNRSSNARSGVDLHRSTLRRAGWAMDGVLHLMPVVDRSGLVT